MTGITLHILGWVLPILLGPVVYIVARELLNVTRQVDDLPPLVKRLSVIALSALVVGAFNVLGVALPAECYLEDSVAITTACAQAINAPSVVKAITAALVAFGMHALKKSRPNA